MEEGIFAEAEIPAGWGLLVRNGDALRLARSPVTLDASVDQRGGLLEMIAMAGTRAMNRAAGVVLPPSPWELARATAELETPRSWTSGENS